MKKALLIFSLFFPLYSIGQEVKQLDDKDGIVVTYKVTKLKEDDKKDTYLVICNAKNTNDYDVFYEAPANKVNPFFSTVSVRNASDYIYLTGIESKLYTANKSLFYIKKGSSVSVEKEFKISKGVSPLLTNEFVAQLKNISEIR